MSEDKNLWVEKYRPTKLDDLILPERTKKIVKDFDKDVPHLLLVGRPGGGKTTLARILANDVLGCDCLYINASDENGVDTIRDKVIGFAQTKSFDGKIKIVILDECDYLSKNAMSILRNVIETYSATTRFILTGNEKHKILEALDSRCQSLAISPPLKESKKRCAEILKKEGVKVPKPQQDLFIKLIENHHPDLRKCINELEKFSKSGTLDIEEDENTDTVCDLIYENLVGGKTLETRRYLIDNESAFNSNHENLLKDLLNHFYDLDIDDLTKKQAILIIADHLFKMVHVSDREICCIACLLQIEEIIA